MFAQGNANISTTNGIMAAASESNPHSRHLDFSSDQAAALRDIARNGSGDNSSLYGFNEMGSSGHPHGFSDSFQNLEDSAALLESLAHYDQVSSANEINTAVSNDHFASLLQAAATATGAEAAQIEHNQSRGDASRSPTPEHFAPCQSLPGSEARRKRKQDQRDKQQYGFVANKTARRSSPQDEADQLAREREIWGPEEGEETTLTSFENQHTPIAGADARAVGVHSAAALFRRPSTASKKYTRAPMSKIFTSLELTPEQFLHLQGAAKAYMLDENYPERSQSVGTRSRGDSDMIKLKLFECVRCFLEDEGWGERCFGESAPLAESRRLKWPQMKNKIITLVTPLMRRMVTNERQRMYALETRKTLAAAKQAKGQQDPASATSTTGGSPLPDAQPNAQLEASSTSSTTAMDIDPKLNQYHYSIESLPQSLTQSLPPQIHQLDVTTPPRTGTMSLFAKKAVECEGLKYLVSVMQDGRRVMPRFTLTPNTCPTFSSLILHIDSVLDDDTLKVGATKVMGPGGLVDVSDEGSWVECVEVIKQNEWMDEEVRCVVQV